MVSSPGCAPGKSNLQHQHRHLVRGMHHGRDVHGPTAVSGNDQRGPAAADFPIDGYSLGAVLARHLAVSRIQGEFPRLCHSGFTSDSAPSRSARIGSLESHAPASARDARQCEGRSSPSVVRRLQSRPRIPSDVVGVERGIIPAAAAAAAAAAPATSSSGGVYGGWLWPTCWIWRLLVENLQPHLSSPCSLHTTRFSKWLLFPLLHLFHATSFHCSIYSISARVG